ncbi:MAG: DNA mismatch repair endonuclease MutL [Treponema sp.]|nr:DNA mismatch repair endonuclease MutL [Treponema sp.]
MESESKQIKILPPGEAMRIAAGEVIDRPAALVREFLDNAIDAGSLNIEVSIEEGGCKKIEVSDDGEGMNRDDLELCTLAHATSKIRGLDDLDTSVTLGFRGEALAAAAASARLEITCSADGRQAWFLQAGPGENHPPEIKQIRRTKGATVRALNLFESIPARKRFLKREGSEGNLCRQAFNDKALAFPQINFRYVQDGKLKIFLPAVSSKKERFALVLLQPNEKDFLHEINVTGNGFSAAIVIGEPQLYRNDRRQMHVFANGRKVNDYSLIQAMEYGAAGWFPNGAHPVASVYIEIDPSLADFNIHPAKREVRFRDPGAIHQVICGGVKNFFHSFFLGAPHKNEETLFENTSRKAAETLFQNISHGNAETRREEFNYKNNKFDTSDFLNDYKEKYCNNSLPPRFRAETSENMRYAGRAFGLFILIEWGDKLYIIDQHAAHERILYDRFLEKEIPKQELLAPIPFSADSEEEDSFLEAKRGELSRLGVEIKKEGNSWIIEALPADWRMTDTQTIKEILDLRNAGENMAQRWAATLCCRAAIKDGDYPDDETAFELGRQALMLPQPLCPHGRPVWTEIGRQALYKAVRRE